MTTKDEAASSPKNPWQPQPGTLGSFIRMQRQLADLSLREMAAMTTVSNAYLSQIERDLHQPSLKVMQSIADALDIPTADLLRQAGVASPQGDSATTASDDSDDTGDSTDTGDDSGDVSDTSDTGDDSGDTGDDS